MLRAATPAGDAAGGVTALVDHPDASVAAAARASMSALLGRIGDTPWAGVAWSFSRLTACGFPLELSFSSRGDTIRYTAEAAGPHVDDHERVESAAGYLAAAGQPVPEPFLRVLRTLQQDRPLRFGAWIGARHDAAGDRFKLYAEVPPTAAAWRDHFGDFLGDGRAVLDHNEVRPRGLALEPARGYTELYLRLLDAEPWIVRRIGARLGLDDASEALLAELERVCGRPVDEVLRGNNFGCSICVVAGRPVAIAVFGFARMLFGPDRWVRRRLLDVASSQGWALDDYASATTPLEHATTSRAHGALAVMGAVGGSSEVQITVCPKELVA